MFSQIERLTEEIKAPGSDVVRKLAVARDVYQASREATELGNLLLQEDLSLKGLNHDLPQDAGSPADFGRLPYITQHILPFLAGKSYQPNDHKQWASKQVEAVIRLRESLAKKYGSVLDYNWLLAIPMELLEPDTHLTGRLVDKVPIKYRIEAMIHFLRPVFDDIARHHKDTRSRNFALNVIGVECFYHVVTLHDELAGCFLRPRNAPVLIRSLYIKEDTDNYQHIVIDVEELKYYLETLDPQYADDALFARVLLTKMAIGNSREGHPDTRDHALPIKILKEGNVVFWHVEGTNPALYWCKYGSPKLLAHEKRALGMMRDGSFRIRRFLYEIRDTMSLEADYTAVLVSSHQGAHNKEPEELEVWLQSPERSDDLLEAFKEIDKFFNILHIKPADCHS